MTSIGIDTSNYTTSVAKFDGNKFKMTRKVLDVKAGMRGIRQSDGGFIHNRELPGMIDEIVRGSKADCVGVSTTPRNAEKSYMPVFTVGHGYARAIAAAMDVNMYEFSHQDGHIMAGVHSANAQSLLDAPFISVHISGGTTEILCSEYDGCRFLNKIIGGTLDISAGQLVDRVGVAMGLKFPCGKEIEKLALQTTDTIKMPYSVKDSFTNLSGVETKLLRLVNGPNPVIARTVLEYIKDVLIKTISNAIISTKIYNVLIVGGVASNSIIRTGLSEEFKSDIYFATPELSTDNAVGIAILAHMAERNL